MPTAREDAWPTEIRLSSDKRGLHIAFDDGAAYDLDAEFLRVLSPSAEVRGHTEAERKTVGGKRNVGIAGVEPVGNYAIRITFDDRHDSGLYSWAYLRELGENRERLFANYLDELAIKGLDRDRPGQK